MRFVLAFAALVTAGCASTPAAPKEAAAPAAVAGTQTAQAKAEGPKKVCRRMTTTGSLQPQRVCSTPDEWAVFDKRAKDNADTIDEQRRAGAQGTNGERRQ